MSTSLKHQSNHWLPLLAVSFLVAVNVACEINCLLDNNSIHLSNNLTGKDCIEIDGAADKIVCVCDQAQELEHNHVNCNNDLIFDWPQHTGQAILLETTRAGQRWEMTRLLDGPITSSSINSNNNNLAKIIVNITWRHQEILGWGGAFTDAASLNIKSLPEPLANSLLASYYGPNGLEYNIGRVPIGGTDFSTRAYSYNDTPEPDLNLTQWALAPEDLEYKIPALRRAIQLTAGKLKLFASPWSPPKWMKTNNNFNRGHLINTHEIYQAYAKYLINFFKAYRSLGIEFWGATVQNEPGSSNFPLYFFNSLQMSSTEMIKFIGQYYGPALEESLGFNRSNFKLIAGDDSLGFLNYYLPSIMHNRQVQRYVSGIAFHWYLSGFLVPYEALNLLLNSIVDTKYEFVMMSEACQGAYPSRKHVLLGNWARGESYASDIIEDIRRKTSAWIDWNLALNMEGGPNWSGNFVDSPIIVDAKRSLFYKQPMYYALAHFTKLIRPGSFVVDAQLEAGSQLEGVTFVGAHRMDTHHTIVSLLNKSNNGHNFTLVIQSDNATRQVIGNIQLKPRSVTSVVVKL